MSGYVGYLGKYRHSSDADIKRASAEHQGMAYVEEPSYKSKHEPYASRNKSSEYNAQSQFNVQNPKRHRKPIGDSSDALGQSDFAQIDAQMAQPKTAKQDHVDCKIVYKKKRKISMSNFQS